jgi:SAM-dependent methyltransferase
VSDSPWYADRFDATYLETYAHRDRAEAERATQCILAPLGLQGRRVLDLCCGAGRHLGPLVSQGARAVGLDLSAPLLSAARAAVDGGAALVRADMQRLPFRPASFDHVINMFTSFGYLPQPEDDRAVLDEVARVLAPGGMFVLDTFNAERVRDGIEPETRRTVGRWEVVERRRLEAGRVIKDIAMQSGSEIRRYREDVRLWMPGVLAAAVEAAGFTVRATHGDYDGGAFDAQRSPRCVIVGCRASGTGPSSTEAACEPSPR